MKVFIFCFLLAFFLYQLLLFVLITVFSLLFSSNWLVKPSRWPKPWQTSTRRLLSRLLLRRGNPLRRHLLLPPLRSVQLSSRERWSVSPVNNQVILPPNAPPIVLLLHLLLLQRQRQRRRKILIKFAGNIYFF